MERRAVFHLPGLFEFTDLYRAFFPLYFGNPEWFYEDFTVGSVYGAPADCLWGGGRVGFGEDNAEDALALLEEFGISGRLTFSNSLLTPEHLTDRKCNKLCALFEKSAVENGVIVHSELLLDHLKHRYPRLYFVSSTTKVLTDFSDLVRELDREEFRYVVPDFRFNRDFEKLNTLTPVQRQKAEFLVNECCDVGCKVRRACYENVSWKNLGEPCADHVCRAPGAEQGYRFSRAMENPAFIGTEDIRKCYLPMGLTQFKIEGRGLGSAVVLEFLLYYLTKPEYRLRVREEIYLDSDLDLF